MAASRVERVAPELLAGCRPVSVQYLLVICRYRCFIRRIIEIMCTVLLWTVFMSVMGSVGAWKASPSGAYVHIPFCRRRCFYCDFPIQVVGDSADYLNPRAEEYTAVLEREISATAVARAAAAAASAAAADGHLPTLAPAAPRPLETVYFGGGTPSLLPVHCVARILNSLSRYL